eukprot:2349921-Amphidinium_carterae.1
METFEAMIQPCSASNALLRGRQADSDCTRTNHLGYQVRLQAQATSTTNRNELLRVACQSDRCRPFSRLCSLLF